MIYLVCLAFRRGFGRAKYYTRPSLLFCQPSLAYSNITPTVSRHSRITYRKLIFLKESSLFLLSALIDLNGSNPRSLPHIHQNTYFSFTSIIFVQCWLRPAFCCVLKELIYIHTKPWWPFTCLNKRLHNDRARVVGKQKRWVCALAASNLSLDWFKQKCAYGAGPALSKYHPAATVRRPDKTILPFLDLICYRVIIEPLLLSAMHFLSHTAAVCTSYHHAARLFCWDWLLCRLLSTNNVM